jgi:pimeloyl-ACP methyl ester carboxylesterase
MSRRHRARRAVAALFATVTVAGLTATAPAAPAGADHEPALPIVFVHGFSGSAQQYETQAMRFASNGYPNVVTAVDRNSLAPADFDALDAFFDNVMAETGSDQIYAVGHSQGTFVMASYLASSPERAARVAKYIGIDGLSLPACPGSVECMGLWARGPTTRVLGSRNVYLSDQGHTQSVGSEASFAAQYEFLTGHAPATHLVLPEPPGQVEIAGRAVSFPANTGLAGSTVEVFEVHPATGARKSDEPVHTVSIGEDGNFGPLKVNGQQRYEIQVTRQSDEGPRFQHFYYEPFLRDDYLVRLNLSPLDSALSQAIDRGPHASVSVVRQKEWWGNNPLDPANIDALDITTTTPDGVEAAGNIINAVTAPYTGSLIAVITFDNDADGVTDTTAQVPVQPPFISGFDAYMPAPTDPPEGTITFTHEQRREGTQVINTPNWSSEAGHGMTVTFRDWVQDFDTWGGCKRAQPSPC